MTVDTLTLAREFRAAEFSTGQAEAIGRASTDSMTGAATKADIANLETKIEAMQAKILIWVVSTQIAVGALMVAMVKL